MDTATMPPQVSVRGQIWNFGRHYVEMYIAMCVGVALTTFVLRGAAEVGRGDVRQGWPRLSLLVMSISIMLPMAAWMRLRGMALRPILETSAAAIAAVMVVAWPGIVCLRCGRRQRLWRGLRGHARGFARPPGHVHGPQRSPPPGG